MNKRLHTQGYSLEPAELGQIFPWQTKRSEKTICPNCRSILKITGVLDKEAKSLQRIICPVCEQELIVSAARARWWGGISTFTWQPEVEVITKGPEPIPAPIPIAQKLPGEEEIFWEKVEEEAKEERLKWVWDFIKKHKKTLMYVGGGIAVFLILKDVLVKKILK